MVNKVDGNNYYVYTRQRKIEVPDADEKFSLGYQKNESPPDTEDRKVTAGQEKQKAAERSGVSLELSANAQEAEANRQKKAEAEPEKARNMFVQFPLLETIRTYFMAAVAAVRDFFYRMWNDRPQEERAEIQPQEIQPQDISEALLLEENLPDIGESEENPPDAEIWEENLPGDGISEENLSDAGIWEENLPAIRASEENLPDARLSEETRAREIQKSLRAGDMEHVISLLTDNGKRTVAKHSTLLSGYDKNGRAVEPSASVMERILHGDKNTWEL